MMTAVCSEVAAYEFTTLTTVPGCIKYKGAKIQLLDLPGIIEGAKDGKGRGRQVIAVARQGYIYYGQRCRDPNKIYSYVPPEGAWQGTLIRILVVVFYLVR